MRMRMKMMVRFMSTHMRAQRTTEMRAHIREQTYESTHMGEQTNESTYESTHMRAHNWEHTYESRHMRAQI